MDSTNSTNSTNSISTTNHTSVNSNIINYTSVNSTTFNTTLYDLNIRLIQICNSQYTKYQNVILWLSGINLLIEDIPQLVIQILYKTNTYGFDIIPFMSLILCSIIIVVGKHKTRESVCKEDKEVSRKDSKKEKKKDSEKRHSSDTMDDVDEWGVPRYI
ncbi:hypothetical protein C2G38_2137270 [Gigaspora rosea]|uniref:Uncharacterized protein n=1 Tax=Gigaspora rosea TaxID=44941 RepID=A0A397W5K1_9GLOM|nr:hypothetical protein C2G38_2137270 [Gigaspora rosea]